jgi:hypothetical protein
MNQEQKNTFKKILKQAGWFENRSEFIICYDQLVKILPEEVLRFISSYCNLKVQSFSPDGKVWQEIEFFPDTVFCDLYLKQGIGDFKTDLLEKSDIIRGNEDEVFYYSQLLGTQLYPVADLKEQGLLLIDCNANVYDRNFLPQLNWVGKGFEEGLMNTLFGTKNYCALDDTNMVWVDRDGKLTDLDLPLNQNLKQINPWNA